MIPLKLRFENLTRGYHRQIAHFQSRWIVFRETWAMNLFPHHFLAWPKVYFGINFSFFIVSFFFKKIGKIKIINGIRKKINFFFFRLLENSTKFLVKS